MKFRKMVVMCLSVLTLGLFTACKPAQYDTFEYVITDSFENISINTDQANIEILPAWDGVCKVVCNDKSRIRHTVGVQDGTLSVTLEAKRGWYDVFELGLDNPSITIYLTETKYNNLTIEDHTGDVKIQPIQFENVDILLSTADVECRASATNKMKIVASTGDIHVEEISAGSLDVVVSTGDVTINNVTVGGLSVTSSTGDCNVTTAVCDDVTLSASTGKTYLVDMTCVNLTSDANTGSLTMDNVISAGNWAIERTTGDVIFNDCDAAEILIDVSTGDVTGTLLSEKIFIPRATSGDIDVPETVTGGKCKITTSSGDITIKIQTK